LIFDKRLAAFYSGASFAGSVRPRWLPVDLMPARAARQNPTKDQKKGIFRNEILQYCPDAR
jgi:hypothetical protein